MVAPAGRHDDRADERNGVAANRPLSIVMQGRTARTSKERDVVATNRPAKTSGTPVSVEAGHRSSAAGAIGRKLPMATMRRVASDNKPMHESPAATSDDIARDGFDPHASPSPRSRHAVDAPMKATASGGAVRVTAVRLAAEIVWVVAAVLLALRVNGFPIVPIADALAPALVFALVMVSVQGAFGVYGPNDRYTFSGYIARLLLAMAIAVPVAYVVADWLPRGGEPFQNTVRDWVTLAFAGLLVARQVIVKPLGRALVPRRVLVLGTGPEARLVEASLEPASGRRIQLVGFYPLEKVQEIAVASRRVLRNRGSLEDTVRTMRVDEIIVAVREQRGGVLPLRQLLDCRLEGVLVTDLARFFERVHGQIPIDSLKASWLIYGNGFRQDWQRSLIKRVFDVAVSLFLLVLAAPLMALTTLAIVVESGFPVIYRQERIGFKGRPFSVLKFRSMRQDAEKDGKAVWAAKNDPRVTRFGRFLRRTRIDELPQLINVLRGEMSFVGPRPERGAFVAMLTEQIPFYAVRHSVKPGITGWAQVRYSYGATVEQSLKKVEYDLYYVKNHSLWLDLRILFETVRVVLSGEGAR